MSKKVKLILVRCVWSGETLLDTDLVGVRGTIGGAKIGGLVRMSSGSVVGFCGDEWEQVVDVSKGPVPLKIEVWNDGFRRAYDEAITIPPEKKDGLDAGSGMYVRSLASDFGEVFSLHYSVQEYKGGRAATKKIETRRNRRESRKAAKVVVPLGVRILRDGAPMSQKNRTIVVGEKVNLSLDSPAGGSKPSAFRWRIDGVIVKDFVASRNKGNVVSLTLEELTRKDVTFAWASVGSAHHSTALARCSAIIDGVEYVATETFEVKMPSVKTNFLRKDFTPSLSVGPNENFQKSPDNWYVALGGLDGITPGFVFFCEVASPTGEKRGADRWHYVQVVRTKYSYTSKDGRYKTWGSKDVWACDGKEGEKYYPYAPDAGKDNPPAFRLGKQRFDDQPSLRLDAKDQEATWKFSAQAFVMYKPGGADSIYVPLRVVEWHIAAEVTRNAGGSWPGFPAKESVRQRTIHTTRFPEWEHHITEKQFWREK